MPSSDSKNEEIGKFFPAKPPDSLGVLRLFAVASKVVCAKPDNFLEITRELSEAVRGLVPPESLAAKDCIHLWEVFSRFAAHPKPLLRIEAGKAFCRDLDSMGQRLQLPPLLGWERLPECLIEGRSDAEERGLGADEIIKGLRKAASKEREGKSLAPAVLSKLLREVAVGDREKVLQTLVSTEDLSRGEVTLLVRWLSTNNELESDDELLVEILERVGTWLVK